jgi:nitrous oxidase accessory protein
MIASFILIGRGMRRERRALSLKMISLFLIALALAFLCFPRLMVEVNADSSRIVVPDDYPTIQLAVDAANVGDTVFVRNGTYFENVIISKALTVIGEYNSSTIVDGSNLGPVFTVSGSYVRVANFTIQNSGTAYPNSGIRALESSRWCVFSDNIIVNNFIGVLLSSSYADILEENQILNAQYGVYFLNAGGNRVTDNTISNNYQGFVMFSSPSNIIVGNTVQNNTVGMSISACSGNAIYYNNFNNRYQTIFYPNIYPNIWDNGYPAGGNYWNDYHGRDVYRGPYQNVTGSDGIGDVPYQMNANNTDNFPYMDHVSVFHDLVLLSVSSSSQKLYQGQELTISANVANVGNYTETFNVSTYYVNDLGESLISTASVTNLTSKAQTVVAFEWNTSLTPLGNYTVRARIVPVEGEQSLANNVLDDGTVAVVERFHDVAVSSVVCSASKVYQGQVLNVSVTVTNVGSYAETFDVAVYYDDFVVGQRRVANLASGGQLTLVYGWDTTNVEPGIVYLIKAVASAVAGEVNLDNNVLVGGSVKVRSLALDAVKVVQVVSSDQFGNPSSIFNRGAISYFKVMVNNTSVDSETVLVTVNVYDSLSMSLGVVSFKGLIVPGISTFILGIPVSNAAHSGTAVVYANSFTDWPFEGGLPYGPEQSAAFQISG